MLTSDSREDPIIIHHPHRRLLFTLLGCLAVALVGCGKQDARFEVRGKVSFEGEPIAEGKILFLPDDESRSQAIAQISDGEYVTASPGGVFPGKYKVQVFGYRGTGKIQDLGALYGKQEEQVQYVPDKFNHKTELTVEFSSEKTVYDFEL